MAASGDPYGLDPHISAGGGDHKYFWTMTEGLVQYNQQGLPDPAISLSNKWEVRDGATIVFSLRQGVNFHDGTPFNAAAVKLNFERILDPKVGSSAFGQMSAIAAIETPDMNTVQIKLKEPNAAFLTLLGDRGGQMLSPASFKDRGQTGTRGADGPVGTGAFKFVRWDRDSVVIMEKNPSYWRKDAAGGALPYLDRIEVSSIADATVREANLESGATHITEVSVSRLDTYEKSTDWQVATFKGARTVQGYGNTRFAPYDDVRLRRAISYAFDRKAENTVVHKGRATVEDRPGPFSPAYQWMYPGSVASAPNYDPAESKKLLSAMGYSGQPVTMTYSPGAEAAPLVALYSNFFQAVGIKPNWVGPVQNVGEAFWAKGTAPLLLPSSLSIRSDVDGIASESLHSSGYYNAGHRTDGDFGRLDSLVVAGRSAFEPAKRKEIYQQVATLASELVIHPYTVYGNAYRVASAKVGNFNTIFGSEGKDRWAGLWLK